MPNMTRHQQGCLFMLGMHCRVKGGCGTRKDANEDVRVWHEQKDKVMVPNMKPHQGGVISCSACVVG